MANNSQQSVALPTDLGACTPLENGNDCGDEGRLCKGCMARAAAKWSWLRHVPKYAVMPVDDEYYQELRDAGRI